MYIRKIEIRNIRSIQELSWEIPEGREAGWHVIIGDNGSGKSTFLRSVALALLGKSKAPSPVSNTKNWVKKHQSEGKIRLTLNDKYKNQALDITVYSDGKTGKDSNISRHSIFAIYVIRNQALNKCLKWLQDLKFKQLEGDPEGDILDSVKKFINQPGFLPHQSRLHEITSRGVEFIDGNGVKLSVEDLSDGYHYILSIVFELIFQLVRSCYRDKVFDPKDKTKIIAPGVVLIDDIEEHLHPTWQQRIGIWFREHFPNLQFIVTTHSPLICQAATVGTVFRLPKPDSDETGEMITGQNLARLLYGNILDAYGTEVFGSGVTRSEESKQKLRRLAELNRKELHGKLTQEEEQEQEKLRAMMPTAAHKTK